MARLKPGVSLQEAQNAADAVSRELARTAPDSYERVRAVVVGMRDSITGNARSPLLLLFAAAGLVLVVAGGAAAQSRFRTTLLSALAGLALVLAAVGLYGVLAYSVSQRTREIGIRVALGAQPSAVTGLVFRQGMVLVFLGIGLGTLGAMTTTRYLEGMLFGLTPLDPATFLAVSLFLVMVIALAASVPARRATQVDPMVALRAE